MTLIDRARELFIEIAAKHKLAIEWDGNAAVELGCWLRKHPGLDCKLASVPCIGPLQSWQRNYVYESAPLKQSYPPLDRWYDYHRVSFELFGADSYFHAGRRVHGRDPYLGIYVDGHFRFATGTYDLRSQRVVLDFCGWSDRPSTKSGSDH
jgi:hypothetical protein